MTVPQTAAPTLAAFLLERLSEDEAVARAATPGRWKLWAMEVRADLDGTSNLDTSLPVARTSHEAGLRTFNAAHIARHDPARVLADVESKRRIVGMHGDGTATCPICVDEAGGFVWDDGPPHEDAPCPTLRALAAPYSDHADYREEWR